ncbi:PP2C family protein-serine/threonine phosphatase [Longispora sp. NPDC051575]|uniref:PP2C family protein-serine/threonine phosphatase n=1 Tax=Longispora sp. NPDC051575 TaxID=3154943 RepID=UPI00341E0FA6
MSLQQTRRTHRPEARAGLGAAFVLLALIVVIEIADGERPNYLGLLALPPLLSAAFAGWRSVLITGAASFGVGCAFVMMPDSGHWYTAAVLQLVAVCLSTGIGIGVAKFRGRQLEQLATLTHLASVAQQAILRPIGPQAGNLAISGRYVSASAEADIGGDLYEALDTPYGTRLLIGDVRGKGLEAVRLASGVLGSYRHVAYERSDLRAIVSDLDRAVSRSVGYEDFVTAAIIEERGGTLTVVNCGHPPPLLLRRGQVISLDPPAPAPPLGFMPAPPPRVERLEPGDRLLLYTDGLTEARRSGEFFPIQERAWGLLGHGTVADGLASLETALLDWVHGVLDDDIAMVLLEYTATRPPVEPATPSWAVGEN